ncbi:MAG: glutaredoxin family protein [Actinomycetales bacterium]|nr:glutaredoxin family protein [Actinomycetales bacterium]
MANGIEITLIGKPGCHLCEDARLVLDQVVSEFTDARPAASVTVTELNIQDDAALAAKHAEEIPVVLINGNMHTYWRIDAERLMTKLTETTDA